MWSVRELKVMGSIAGGAPKFGRVVPVRAAPTKVGPRTVQGAYPIAAWLALIGLIVPAEMTLRPAGIAITPGRVGLILLLFPAIYVLCKRGGRVLSADLFVCATSAWMTGAAVYVSGWGAISSAPGAESVEFLGSYLVARAFFFGPVALTKFIRVLKFLSIILIMLALAEFISGRSIVHHTFAAIVGANPAPVSYRLNALRAMATFDHAILFGAFCPLVTAILLYWERNALRKALWVGLCFIGCIVSLTSVALMSFFIVLALYTYDRMMRQYRWRWGALWMALAIFLLAIYLATNAPLGWVITHLTFDPESGYFRYMIWDASLVYISQAPLAGYAFNLLHHDILDHTVDSVWLVSSLRYGVPMIAFLLLANLAAFLPTRTFKNRSADDINRMSTAFTIVLMMFLFIGLTVHYWNFMWIFWGLCIGIRASLRELSMEAARRPSAINVSGAFMTAGVS
jgi:hypothetical protein